MRLSNFFFLTTIILSSLALSSCFLLKDTITSSIYRSSKSKRNYLTVNTFIHSHCGCTDMFAQKFDKGKLTYELYYGCTPFFAARKIVYSYDNNNKLIATTKYKLVDTTVYEQPFDSLDMFVLHKIDSFRLHDNPSLPEYRICEKTYKGLTKIQ